MPTNKAQANENLTEEKMHTLRRLMQNLINDDVEKIDLNGLVDDTILKKVSENTIRTFHISLLECVITNKDEPKTLQRKIDSAESNFERQVQKFGEDFNIVLHGNRLSYRAPIFFGKEQGALASYLYKEKFIDKKTARSAAQKLANKFEIVMEPSMVDGFFQFAFVNPKMFLHDINAAYKSNPTFIILSKALEKLGLEPLTTQKSRDAYLDFDLTETVNDILYDHHIQHSDYTLTLNVLLRATKRWHDQFQTEEERTSENNLNLLLLIGHCCALLSGSFYTSLLILSSFNQEEHLDKLIIKLARTMTHHRSQTSHILSSTKKRSANNIAFDLYATIFPINDLPSDQSIRALAYIDEYVNSFCKVANTIVDQLALITLNQSGELNSIITHSFALSLTRFGRTMYRERTSLLNTIEEANNSDSQPIKELLFYTQEFFELTSDVDSFSVSGDEKFPETLIQLFNDAHAAIDNILIAEGNKKDIKDAISEAQENNDYDAMIELATSLKNHNLADTVSEASPRITSAIKFLRDNHEIDGKTLAITMNNIKGSMKPATSEVDIESIMKKNKMLEARIADLESQVAEMH